MKIIVVDDEPLVKQYIVQCVRDAGGENEITAAVTSGAKVLQEMKTNPADVVFADITMPKMDGIVLGCSRKIKRLLVMTRHMCPFGCHKCNTFLV